jgi:hypothetical protein
VRYIARREEGLTNGHRRELYGIGERFRAMRGDEPALRKALREDARGLRNPVYFRFILTVDNPAAERFRKLDGYLCERVLRDAVEKTFRGAARGAQGVFAVHQHGGQGRAAHPHVHALLSPRFENWMTVHLSPVRIQRIRQRWETEVLVGLQRQERRLERPRHALTPHPFPRRHERDDDGPFALLPVRKAPRRDGQLELFTPIRRSPSRAQDNPWVARWLRLGCRGFRFGQDPERATRRAVFRLVTMAMPKRIHEVLWPLRGLRGFGGRHR